MNPDDFFFIAGVMAIVFVPIILSTLLLLMWMRHMWSQQKRQIGTIRCKRCNYVGLAKAQWTRDRGIRPVCAKCGGEEWITIEQREEVQDFAKARKAQPKEENVNASQPANSKVVCPQCGVKIYGPGAKVRPGSPWKCPACGSVTLMRRKV